MPKMLIRIACRLAILGVGLAVALAARAYVVPVRVGGASMSPTLAPGDVVFVRRGVRPHVGDIVLVRRAGHQQVLHRVIGLMDRGSIRTKGDANEVPDVVPTMASEVVGLSVAVIPVGAWIARWRGQPAYVTMTSQQNSVRQ
jgi:signal peptidase I